jgi:hypothetical protein
MACWAVAVPSLRPRSTIPARSSPAPCLLAARHAHQRGARDRTASHCSPMSMSARRCCTSPWCRCWCSAPARSRARHRRRRHRHRHIVRRLEPGAGLLPRFRPVERDAVVPRRAVAAPMFGEILKHGVPMSLLPDVEQHRAGGDHRAMPALLGTTALAGFGAACGWNTCSIRSTSGLAPACWRWSAPTWARPARTRRPHRLDRRRPCRRRDAA